VLLAVLAAHGDAAAYPAAQALKAGRTISARFSAVNRKMDKLTRVQAIAGAWRIFAQAE
jgi:hypothetical protein